MSYLNHMSRYFAVMVCIITHGHSAMAETAERAGDGQHDFANVVYSDLGIDHSMLTARVGYGRYFDLASIDRQLLLFADYALPLATLDIADFRTRLGLRTSAFSIGSFHLPVWLAFTVSNANNKIFQATGLGSELGMAPGYYGKLFTIASELYWNQTWTAYLKHSPTYRDMFYEDAQDGWYTMTASSLRAGLHLAWNINQRISLGLKGGYQHTGQFNKLIPPIYGVLNMQFGF